MADSKTTSNQAGIPWNRLRAWIDEQEAFEKATGRARLSQAQRVAIASLVPPVEEPEVGDRDYVSELCMHEQAKRHELPKFDWKDDSINVNGVPQLRWRGSCRLPWCDEVFPQVGYGYETGQEIPSFQAKKKAKQFAAKQALSFLTGLPTKTAPAKVTSQSSPPISPLPKRIKVEQDTKVKPEPATAHPPAIPTPPRIDVPSSDSFDEGGPTIPERVAGLATMLNFGCPSYKIEQDGDKPNIWKGRPYFQQDARVPEDLGVVRGIFGKKKAKLEIAEKVLMWLEEEDRARQETTARLLATLDPVARNL
ncbi:Fc.00g111690.m01.CDS01 [Cosmosporella sp. VM-42]